MFRSAGSQEAAATTTQADVGATPTPLDFRRCSLRASGGSCVADLILIARPGTGSRQLSGYASARPDEGASDSWKRRS